MKGARSTKLRVSIPLILLVAMLSVFYLVSCSSGSGFYCRQNAAVPCIPEDEPFKRLSEYNIFDGDLQSLAPADPLLPFDLNTPLFSDYAYKKRFLYVPKGTSITYEEEAVLEFPVGSMLVKNFYYLLDERQPFSGRMILETRLLIRYKSGWNAETYVWNKEQTEAYLKQTGDFREVNWVGKEGRPRKVNYLIPSKNDCKTCHSLGGALSPLGPRVRNLNKSYRYRNGSENQLARWRNSGILVGLPPHGQIPKMAVWDQPETGTIIERARSYLDVNCSNCHSAAGSANNSALYLSQEEQVPFRLGVCKSPVASGAGSGGLRYGILPCQPDSSILVHRMQSVEPEVRMPEIGRTLVHQEGVALIMEWIGNMECNSCETAP